MVGDGSERQNAEHRARCLGIYDHCSFVGKQPRIVDYLSASDVLLLPSEQESFGLAALEAMACEVPVIASRVGGLPEVVTDGETGYLSPVGDVDKMAADAARFVDRCETAPRDGPARARVGNRPLSHRRCHSSVHRFLRTDNRKIIIADCRLPIF